MKIIAFDGHDVSGKTTLSKILADKTGGTLIKPFSEEAGQTILEKYHAKNYKELEEYAIQRLEECYRNNIDSELLIFDRHWLTIATLLPNNKFTTELKIPKTYVCYASPSVTEKRLLERNDGKEEKWDNDYYCKLYYDLAEKYNCEIIDTSDNPNVEKIVNKIIDKL